MVYATRGNAPQHDCPQSVVAGVVATAQIVAGWKARRAHVVAAKGFVRRRLRADEDVVVVVVAVLQQRLAQVRAGLLVIEDAHMVAPAAESGCTGSVGKALAHMAVKAGADGNGGFVVGMVAHGLILFGLRFGLALEARVAQRMPIG